MNENLVKEIAKMQQEIDSLEYDLLTLLAVSNDKEAAQHYAEPNNPNAAEVFNKIVELHK